MVGALLGSGADPALVRGVAEALASGAVASESLTRDTVGLVLETLGVPSAPASEVQEVLDIQARLPFPMVCAAVVLRVCTPLHLHHPPTHTHTHTLDTLSFVDVRFMAYNKDPDNNTHTLTHARTHAHTCTQTGGEQLQPL